MREARFVDIEERDFKGKPLIHLADYTRRAMTDMTAEPHWWVAQRAWRLLWRHAYASIVCRSGGIE